jgi:hypothetical protein
MQTGITRAMRASIVIIGLVVSGASAQADSEWHNFGKQKFSGLGGPAASASTPSLTGKSSAPTRQARRSSKGVQTASLGRPDVPARRPSVSGGGGVNWVASSGCLTSSLKSVIYGIASSFGSVTVSSTCRSGSHNRRVGGAPKSHHLTGNAADFRVSGNIGAAYASLRSNGSVGGLKHYGGGLFHVDTGARRSW